MFKKILIANRGEIAVRIHRTCKNMGISTVTIFSEADARALHIEQSNESVLIGPAPAAESYLDIDKIIEAALKRDCQAIHPGYGFLSENAAFCEKVTAAGMTFIGPPAKVIAAMGDKISAKEIALKTGVPTVPGYDRPISSTSEACAIAEDIGYPVLLKPSAGGGGKGMRIVNSRDGMEASLLSCRNETIKAFGDDRIFMERFIKNPRHIEIQIMADQHGNVVYMVERECSIQRRYQKIIEESPSMAVNPELREKMGQVSCKLASEVGYIGAGTVEFILDSDQKFYFLEMNTRLQVEHPVTEMVTGLDLVEMQLKVAAGEPLEICQEDISFKGWAIEARICAEDSLRGFMPSTGLVTRYAEPKGKCIRVDSGIKVGSLIGVFYDSLLAKVISWGEDRAEAVSQLISALNGYHIEGPATNITFNNMIFNHPSFIKGDITTNFIAQHMEDPDVESKLPREILHYSALAATLAYHNRQNLVKLSLKPLVPNIGSHFIQKEIYHYIVKRNNDIFDIKLKCDRTLHKWIFVINDKKYKVTTPEFEFYRRRLKLKINGKTQRFLMKFIGDFALTIFCGIRTIFEVYTPREWKLTKFMPESKKEIIQDFVTSPMPGMVVNVMVKKGDRVHRGQELVIIESMKMESGVASPCDAEVLEVIVKQGHAVESGDIMIRFVI